MSEEGNELKMAELKKGREILDIIQLPCQLFPFRMHPKAFLTDIKSMSPGHTLKQNINSRVTQELQGEYK